MKHSREQGIIEVKWFVLDNDHKPVEQPDLIAWAIWHAEPINRLVSFTQTGRYTVSSVFWGNTIQFGTELPSLFETKIFRDDGKASDGIPSFTWEETERVHKAIVDSLVRWKEAKAEDVVDLFLKITGPP